MNQIRRMVLAPSRDKGGGDFVELGLRPDGTPGSGRVARASTRAAPIRSSVTAAPLAGTAEFELCNWQQG
jgi:hypothetical protein